jgi:SAM-dependent methyltransferase
MNPHESPNQAWNAIWRMLDLSWSYRLFRKLVDGRFPAVYVQEHLKVKQGERVLDIGCGPGDILQYLPPVDYFGFDMNADYINAAKLKYRERGTFLRHRVSKELIGKFDGFDLVIAKGLVHHLSDDESMELFSIAWEALKPGGRLVTADGVFTPRQSSAARYFVSRDRGRFMRTEAEYLRLIKRAFSQVESTLCDGLLRIPYTLIMMNARKQA